MKISLALFATALVSAIVGTGCASSDEGNDTSSTDSDFTTASGTGCAFGLGLVRGEIEKKYLALGGCVSFLGPPTTSNLATPDGRGSYAAFYNGSIYYRPDLGAHVVRGELTQERDPVDDDHVPGDLVGHLDDGDLTAVLSELECEIGT